MRLADDEQLARYSRQIVLKEVGIEGQMKLFDARVLVIGAGGLGSAAAPYLAAAGVGTIGLVDGDRVDLSNLQRQIIHTTGDVGRPKVISGAEKLQAIEPRVRVETVQEFVTAANVRRLVSGYDFIIDGTDNFAAKFLINDACVLSRKPFSHAGILRFQGQTMTVLAGQTTCYRCIFGGPPPQGLVPTCSQAGILGAVAGVIGSLQAVECLKQLLGIGQLLTDCLLTFDALTMTPRKVAFRRNPRCPVCGENPSITEVRDEAGAQVTCDLGK